MKKFISFVMAGAMVASLVPATAFAKGEVTATAKIVDAKDLKKGETIVYDGEAGPELQLKLTDVDAQRTSSGDLPSFNVELSLDNAEFTGTGNSFFEGLVTAFDEDGVKKSAGSVTPGGNATVYTYTNTVAISGTYADMKAAGATGLAKSATPDPDGSDYKPWSYFLDKVVADQTVAQQIAKLESLGYEKVTDMSGTWYVHSKTGDKVAEPTSPIVGTDIAAVIAAEATYTHSTTQTVTTAGGDTVTNGYQVAIVDKDEDSVEYKITYDPSVVKKDWKFCFDLKAELTKSSVGTKATVSVDSKAVTVSDLVFATIVDKGIKASVKKTVDIAVEEKTTLSDKGIKLETLVGDFAVGQEIELKLSSGFEFDKVDSTSAKAIAAMTDYSIVSYDDKILTIKVKNAVDEFTVASEFITIESTSAKAGAVATLTVKAIKTDKVADSFSSSASIEVAKVVDYKVNLTVDKDEDLPVIYSGTNVDNAGLTDDSDHMSLEVTAEETFPGAWSMRQGFNFNLPEGVYVTDVKVVEHEGLKIDSGDATALQVENAFKKAYQDGDHKNFEFGKRVFNDVDATLNADEAKLVFQLELVADPTFEGDVKLTFEGSLVDKQEVTIAKFVKPYTVKAEQNDVIIDYRNTEVKTPIVITEAEEGLWKKDTTFKLNIEDDLLTFENDPTFTIDKDSDMKLKDDKADKGTIKFSIKEESDKAATVTISDMKLFMSRSIPAGAYDLEISTTMNEAYDKQVLYAPDATSVEKWTSGDRPSETKTKKDSYVDDVCDYSDVVKAAFINVVTSGRDNDNLFTTKVVVPVGEAYLLAGEAKVELDAPAYISAAGYTMLPVRAISKALGVNTNNVLWNAETRTVTVMYAQRIITMTVGQKTIYVNGSAIPASAAPEIKDGRTFLPLRDLGTALGVTNVNWDAATKTATLN